MPMSASVAGESEGSVNGARLSACCRRCDAVISAPCPFERIGAVSADFDAQGWGYDENLFVVCPDCAAGRRPEPRPAQQPAQGEMAL